MIYDFLELHPQQKEPLWKQIYQGIQQGIVQGKLKEHEKLPSIRVAAKELRVSRTTVETAYVELCNHGFLSSKAQSGFFVKLPPAPKDIALPKQKKVVPYDFSSGHMDSKAADTTAWKKYVRMALNQETDILSYGNAQGEEQLRSAIAAYTFRTRGVVTRTENIVVGAGTQFLLTLFCSLYPKRCTIAMDAPGFKQAERIFRDYGFQTVLVHQKAETPLLEQLEASRADIYFDIPANHPKKSRNYIQEKRKTLLCWLQHKKDRLILEDDYNGELCYTARPIPAMQNLAPEHIVYLGSFSQLLLPSVRIAYMVLPKDLLGVFFSRQEDYNATAGKVEQIALASYIQDGLLEKHLRRLKKLYFEKSRLLLSLLQEALPNIERISILEASLSVIMHLNTTLLDTQIEQRLLEHGVKADFVQKKHIRLSFSGLPIEKFPDAVAQIQKALQIK